MIAAFSLPLFAAWALLDDAVPPRIRSFRVVLTLAAALLMGVMVFVRQRLLDWELLRLLTHSRESFTNLKRLQAQITESEKLASIGQLLGGAAHELNNPITAMLGYSDLLLCTTLTPEQSELAGRIGQHARRTQLAGRQSAQLCQARPGCHGSRGSQHSAAYRRQTLATAVASPQNRSPHRVSARTAARSRRFQPVAPGLRANHQRRAACRRPERQPDSHHRRGAQKRHRNHPYFRRQPRRHAKTRSSET